MDSDLKSDFIDVVKNSLKENIFVKFTLGKYRGAEDGLENIYVNPVRLKEEIKLAFRYKYKTRDVYKNFAPDEALSIIRDELGKNFLYGGLFSTKNDFVIEYNKKRVPRTYTRKASFNRVDIKEHNRVKTRYIDSKEPYLNLLGITNSKGEVKGDKYDKFRQIDKFVEIVSSLIDDSNLAEKEKLSVIDYGSGKSYLSFALYDYLTGRGKFKVSIKGIEQRGDLVEISNKVAEDSGFKDLSFETSSITEHKQKNADIVIALHACDTATDDAIAKALKLDASIIILAPCCQKYIRKQLSVPSDLAPVFRHGILEEHLSSFLTDGLRALTLESLGYLTKIFEFISGEHTSKNIMITAIKGEYSEEKYMEKIMQIEKLKSKFGLKDYYLDKIIQPEK